MAITSRSITIKVSTENVADHLEYKGMFAGKTGSQYTPSKTWSTTVNSGERTPIYFKYLPKPITITFKGNSWSAYTVTGSSIGTVSVPKEGTSKTVIVGNIDNLLSQLDIKFDSATMVDKDWKISQVKIDGSVVTLPYTKSGAKAGSTITVEVVAASATTTTTTTTTTTSTHAPATLDLESNVTIGVNISGDGLEFNKSLSANQNTPVKVDMPLE